ncbi:MAG TPA: DUF4097 family beta strand repeat-containing protein [Rhodothermales bacterium]|nr:DUF4097 family beta strand repeat-containing protein [Rhodothermales bacterium]
MMTQRKVLLGVLGLLTALLFVNAFIPLDFISTSSAQHASADDDEVIERTFDVSPGQTLTLDTDLGKVHVRGGSRDEVFVRVIKSARGNRDRAEEQFKRFEIEFEQSSRGVSIKGDHDGHRNGWRGNRLSVEYEITVPTRFNVFVETAGGSIRAEAIEGEVSLDTSGGSITALDINGPLEIDTSGGSVTAENIGGAAQLHTSGGSITVNGAGGDVVAETSGGSIRLSDIYGTVNAETSGGSITADVAIAPDGPMKLSTSGGSITLHLTSDARVDVDASASGGRVRSDLPVRVEGEISRSRLRGEINGGGPLLRLRSSGGGIRIAER